MVGAGETGKSDGRSVEGPSVGRDVEGSSVRLGSVEGANNLCGNCINYK